MKIKKIGQFIKQYGFYLAVGVVSLVAIIAMFVMPKGEGNVKDLPNSYANNSQVDGTLNNSYESNVTEANENSADLNSEDDIREYLEKDGSQNYNAELDGLEEEVDLEQSEIENTDANIEDNSETEIVENNSEEVTTDVVENATDEIIEEEIIEEVAEVETETFESTTVSVMEEPFFADGDKFTWPVEGEIVVPYTDNSTKHWFSESFNYTMRTFGVCIGAEEASNVVAVAKGRVLEVIEDSSSSLELNNTPYVGKALIIDHGNGYQSVYGFQGGTINADLIGEIVNEGDILGQVGSPKGAFVNVGSNIYLQVKHNDEIVDPTTYLKSDDSDANKEDSVDVGFSE